eukprot:1001364-Karenia_brevis.AAC.1
MLPPSGATPMDEDVEPLLHLDSPEHDGEHAAGTALEDAISIDVESESPEEVPVSPFRLARWGVHDPADETPVQAGPGTEYDADDSPAYGG